MERVSKKKIKHLIQEERIKQRGDSGCIQTDELMEELELDEDIGKDKSLKLMEEELTKLMQEYEKLMQQSMEKTGEMTGGEELMEEMTATALDAMSPEDLELLKKKQRAKEMKEILEADLLYLRALFDKLAKKNRLLRVAVPAAVKAVSL